MDTQLNEQTTSDKGAAFYCYSKKHHHQEPRLSGIQALKENRRKIKENTDSQTCKHFD